LEQEPTRADGAAQSVCGGTNPRGKKGGEKSCTYPIRVGGTDTEFLDGPLGVIFKEGSWKPP